MQEHSTSSIFVQFHESIFVSFGFVIDLAIEVIVKNRKKGLKEKLSYRSREKNVFQIIIASYF